MHTKPEQPHPHADCENLSSYLDGELVPELRAKVEAHIEGCADCRALHDDLVAMLRCCAEAAPSPSVPPDVHEALLALIRKAAESPDRR